MCMCIVSSLEFTFFVLLCVFCVIWMATVAFILFILTASCVHNNKKLFTSNLCIYLFFFCFLLRTHWSFAQFSRGIYSMLILRVHIPNIYILTASHLISWLDIHQSNLNYSNFQFTHFEKKKPYIFYLSNYTRMCAFLLWLNEQKTWNFISISTFFLILFRSKSKNPCECTIKIMWMLCQSLCSVTLKMACFFFGGISWKNSIREKNTNDKSYSTEWNMVEAMFLCCYHRFFMRCSYRTVQQKSSPFLCVCPYFLLE